MQYTGWGKITSLNFKVNNQKNYSRYKNFIFGSNINETLSPFQVFHIFINNDIISHIKTETNKYATQKRKGPISKNWVFSRWKPVTISEIERFLAIIVHMGFVRKPRLWDYWSTNPIYDSKFSSSLQISRDRFLSMLTFPHLNNNDAYIPRGNPGHDMFAIDLW